MKSKPGTYALILRSHSIAKVQVGRWGKLDLEPGYYIYVGSAFGPGGVQARVLRHCRQAKAQHWHIDYLREHVKPVGAWLGYDAKRLEHHWAHVLKGLSGISSIEGFGCSDCTCYSHLFYTAKKPNFVSFSAVSGGHVETWSYGIAV